MSQSTVAPLLLRSVVGGTMVAHGLRHGRTLEGTAGWFESIGFREPMLQARLSAMVEVGAGTALLLGAGTPFAASAVVGTMAVAARTVHVRNGFFITEEGFEYVLTLAAASTALAASGPGWLSVDRLLKRENKLTGLKGAVISAGLGVAAAAGQLRAFWREPQR